MLLTMINETLARQERRTFRGQIHELFRLGIVERTQDHIEGEPDTPRDQKPHGVLSSASEGYASALGLRVVKGRWLTDHEPTPVFVY
jgi:hypothetical protein